MECKFGRNRKGNQPDPRINRNIVECKFLIRSLVRSASFELLETLWNVNNSVAVIIDMSVSGINRNIVECKYVYNNKKY